LRPLADALRGTLAALGIRGAVAKAGVVAAWPAAARACIGEDASRTRALAVEGDTLVVAVPSPVLAQELRLHSEQLLRDLAGRAPDATVHTIRFVPLRSPR